MKQPKAKDYMCKLFDCISLECPWCGEQMQGLEGKPPDRSDDALRMRERVWLDSVGRAWHVGCANVALGKYKDNAVTKMGENT